MGPDLGPRSQRAAQERVQPPCTVTAWEPLPLPALPPSSRGGRSHSEFKSGSTKPET